MALQIRFTLPKGTHTDYTTTTIPARLRSVWDGEIADVEDIGYPGADHFISRGMAVYVEDPPHGEAVKKSR